MGRRREAPAEEETAGAPEWIVTFTDMISLLVTFFVLLMTFSTIEEFDMLRVRGVLLGAGGALEDGRGFEIVAPSEEDLISATDPLVGASTPPDRPVEALTERNDEAARRRDDTKELRLSRAPDGVLVRFGPEASFAPGSAQMSPALVDRLRELAAVMRDHPHRIVVEGHTDARFRPTSQHPDAESLSLARARAAADQLVSLGIDRSRVLIAARGDAQPADPRATPEARLANRRVEIRLVALDAARHAAFERAWSGAR